MPDATSQPTDPGGSVVVRLTTFLKRGATATSRRRSRPAVVLYQDTNEKQVDDFIEGEGEDDTPLEVDGEHIVDTACITIDD